MIETAAIRLARPSRDLGAAERRRNLGAAERLEAAGGTRVDQGPYWNRWGVSVRDPDGYRLVLSRREWSNAS
jgi:hypothetical protein